MKKTILAGILAAAMAVPTAFALPTVVFSDGPGNTGGGAFNAATSADGNLITFCLEVDEFLTFGTTFYYQKSPTNTTSTGDTISAPTAWLFSQMMNGTLGSWGLQYVYTHNQSDANDLQRAIWYLEDEGSLGANNYFAQLAVAQAGSKSIDYTGTDVAVMVLWSNSDGTGAAQDQLMWTRVPDGGTSLIMLGAALAGLALFRRKFARS
jgi:VPDSG-CTERM motif